MQVALHRSQPEQQIQAAQSAAKIRTPSLVFCPDHPPAKESVSASTLQFKHAAEDCPSAPPSPGAATLEMK
jgi:hypothetical protein